MLRFMAVIVELTEVVPEGQVQQSEQSTELYELSLHPLHLLLEVMVLQNHKKHTQIKSVSAGNHTEIQASLPQTVHLNGSSC